MEPRGFFCHRLDSSVNGQEVLGIRTKIPTPVSYVGPSSSVQCTNLPFWEPCWLSRFSAPAIKHIWQQGRTYSPAVPGGRPRDGPAILTQVISTKQLAIPFCGFAPTQSSCTGHPKPMARGVPSATTLCLAPATLNALSRLGATFDCLWWTLHVFSGNESLLWQKIQNKENKIA